ncbi:MAG: single-stranded-DNA-specific exonuclease RecJ, partial [Oscillospiraceae bacterium]
MKMMQWKLPKIQNEKIKLLHSQTGLSMPVCSILVARGYDTSELIDDFIGNEDSFYDPYLMKDMDKAVERIRIAVENQEKIVVYGDYDCDGITSTALLCSYFEAIGADVAYYIPNRDKEGYGLNTRAITAFAKKGINLIITVDNGISSIEEAELAQTLGVDLIITDHHTPREILPKAVAVLNPHRCDCEYPFKELSGVGVAFKLICAMEDDIDCEDTLFHYGSIVAIGTVADVVELKGENRLIVKNSMTNIEDTENIGLLALLKEVGLDGKQLTSTSLAFGIAPRINAAGRVGQTSKAVDLLLTADAEEAEQLAAEINAYNTDRKDTEAEIMKDISEILAQNPKLLLERIIIIAGEGWHHGIIGIIASKIVDRYGKPCLLISGNGEEARGSGRSVDGYSLIDAISRCSERLTRFGGHVMAAGLSLRTDDVAAFTEELLLDAKVNFPMMPANTLMIDAITEPNSLTVENVNQLALLEPFGSGNEQPVFAVMEVTLESITPLSGGKHLRLSLNKNGSRFSALYFGMTPQDFAYRSGDLLDIAATISINEYNGNISVSIKISDIHLHGVNMTNFTVEKQLYEQYMLGEKAAAKINIPTREDVAKVYRFIRSCPWACDDNEMLYCRLGTVSYGKLRLITEILQELELIEVNVVGSKQ